MKKIIEFFKRLWKLITKQEVRPQEINNESQLLCGYTGIPFELDKVIAALESYKDPNKMLSDCNKYGIRNVPNQSFSDSNKTIQAIKEQLYALLYHYEWQGANDSYMNLIDKRIQMFKDIVEDREKERIDELEKEGRLCSKCKKGALQNFYSGLVKIKAERFYGGPIGGGVHGSTTGNKEYQFHYKKCDSCDYWKMYEYRETPSWWDDLWNLDCPFKKGDIIEEYIKGNVHNTKYISHEITRW